MQALALATKKVLQGDQLSEMERESAQAAFIQALRSKGLDIDRIAGKVVEKLESKRSLVIDGIASQVDDNDAQLRAADMGIKLLERAGSVPKAQESAGGSAITVNVLMINQESETKDLTVENES